MNDEPQFPEPPPEVPRGWLWTSLCVPPAVTVMGILLIWLLSKQTGGNLSLELVLATIFMEAVIVLLVVLCFSFVFLITIRVRYRGRSVWFLYSAYLMGQVIVCLALWFVPSLLFQS